MLLLGHIYRGPSGLKSSSVSIHFKLRCLRRTMLSRRAEQAAVHHITVQSQSYDNMHIWNSNASQALLVWRTHSNDCVLVTTDSCIAFDLCSDLNKSQPAWLVSLTTLTYPKFVHSVSLLCASVESKTNQRKSRAGLIKSGRQRFFYCLNQHCSKYICFC